MLYALHEFGIVWAISTRSLSSKDSSRVSFDRSNGMMTSTLLGKQARGVPYAATNDDRVHSARIHDVVRRWSRGVQVHRGLHCSIACFAFISTFHNVCYFRGFNEVLSFESPRGLFGCVVLSRFVYELV